MKLVTSYKLHKLLWLGPISGQFKAQSGEEATRRRKSPAEEATLTRPPYSKFVGSGGG